MKKKGFTLIELLAVIVILAIIALIATPMVLNTIDDAKEGAAKSSASSYMSAVETSLATYMLKNNGNKYAAGKYNVAKLKNDLEVELKGEAPTEGSVCISSNGTVSKASVKVNGYVVNYDGKEAKTTELKEVEDVDCGQSSVSYSHMVGDAVTIDGIGYHVIKNSSTADEYVTLLRDESIGDFVFDENGGTDYETSTIKAYLNSTYKDTFGDKKSSINEITLLDFGNYEKINNSINNITADFNIEGTYTYLYKNYYNIFFNYENKQVIRLMTKSFDENRVIAGSTDVSDMFGLYLSTPDGCASAFGGGVSGNICETGGTPSGYPVRPVITVSKTALN